MLSSEMVADYLRNIFVAQSKEISVYWVETSEARTDFCGRVSESLDNLPIFVSQVASGAYKDPNGIIDDLAKTIEDGKAWFSEKRREQVAAKEKWMILLVSRTPLGVPQISSPVELPDWFPLWPRKLLTVFIKSITDLVDISIADAGIPISLINQGMYDLECELVLRMSAVNTAAPSASIGLKARFEGNKLPQQDFSKFLELAREACQNVSDGADFRPGGAATSRHVVSHLHRLWWNSSPNDLHGIAEDVAKALGIATDDLVPAQFSLASLLCRTAKPKLSETPTGITFSKNVVITTAHSVQFTNAVHHAHEYPRSPAILTVNYANDLARSCRDAVKALQLLP